MMPQKNKEPTQWQRDLGLMGVVTWNLVLYVGLGAGLGWVAVKFLSAPGWVLVPGALLGLWLAMMQIYQLFKGQKPGESE